jgi:hypothetical protein
MKRNPALFVLAATALSACIAATQEISNTAPPPRRITLQEGVQLALKHNHDIRIASRRARIFRKSGTTATLCMRPIRS